jgi:hypothetical protein
MNVLMLADAAWAGAPIFVHFASQHRLRACVHIEHCVANATIAREGV